MKIICIGDSLTRGYGVLPSETWVALLNKSKKAEFINKGINGDTSGGMLARFQKDVIDEKPEMVLIMGGVNDLITGNYIGGVQTNIMAMVQQAYHNGITPIIGTCIKVNAATFREDWAELTSIKDLNWKIHEYRRWLIKFCRIFRTTCIDFLYEFDLRIHQNYDYYLPDGLHPKQEGHQLLAEIAYQNILQE
ncbi:MAG: arylesterase [Clostridia bacterium]|nr:arylesterase [Clostridia bacterium]